MPLRPESLALEPLETLLSLPFSLQEHWVYIHDHAQLCTASGDLKPVLTLARKHFCQRSRPVSASLLVRVPEPPEVEAPAAADGMTL